MAGQAARGLQIGVGQPPARPPQVVTEEQGLGWIVLLQQPQYVAGEEEGVVIPVQHPFVLPTWTTVGPVCANTWDTILDTSAKGRPPVSVQVCL